MSHLHRGSDDFWTDFSMFGSSDLSFIVAQERVRCLSRRATEERQSEIVLFILLNNPFNWNCMLSSGFRENRNTTEIRYLD